MNDDIAHLGIVNRALGGTAPRLFGAFIVRENANKIDGAEVSEIKGLRIADAAAEHQMKLAHNGFLLGEVMPLRLAVSLATINQSCSLHQSA